jgi:hypothetical protein
MTTTWQIANLKRTPDTELVFEVTYIMNFEHEQESDRHVGMVTLTGNASDPSFVPYKNLTETTVEQWVKGKLGAEKIAEIEASALARLQAAHDKKTNPEYLMGTPWRQ